MKPRLPQEFTGRSCPDCCRRTDRVARGWPDRLLSLFIPVARYRCQSAACGWQGLLVRRSRPLMRPRLAKPPCRPEWLGSHRMQGRTKPTVD